MKITIKANVDITPSLQTFVEGKFLPLAKFVKRFDERGEAGIRLDISRTTRHHRKGDIFRAAADLRLPGKILRGEAEAEDIRTAIDCVRTELKLEIKKYKGKRK